MGVTPEMKGFQLWTSQLTYLYNRRTCNCNRAWYGYKFDTYFEFPLSYVSTTQQAGVTLLRFQVETSRFSIAPTDASKRLVYLRVIMWPGMGKFNIMTCENKQCTESNWNKTLEILNLIFIIMVVFGSITLKELACLLHWRRLSVISKSIILSDKTLYWIVRRFRQVIRVKHYDRSR